VESPGSDPALGRVRLEVVAAGAALSAAGLVLPGEGNLSVRHGRVLLMTRAGADLGRLRVVDLVEVPLTGEIPRGASSEVAMHRAIHARRHDIRAVVHAHPPAVLALTAAGGRPDPSLDAAGRARVGEVGWVGFYPPGSEALASAAAEALAAAPVAVLFGHGAVAVGRSLEEAVDRMRVLERLAHAGLACGRR